MHLPACEPSTRRRLTRGLAAAALTLAVGAAGTLCAGPADAASTWPGTPTGLRVSAAGRTWLTVSLRPSVHARSYRLYTSTYKPDLYYDNLVHGRTSSARRSVVTSRPAITVSHLTYSTAVIYYRVVALNGSEASYSAGISQTGLAPSTPTSLTVQSSAAGTYLTWNSGPATGFTVAQATNPAMTVGRRNYSIYDTSHRFTPNYLATGTRYYFTVRALNGPTPSHYATQTSIVVRSREQSVRVMSYNVLHLMFDGTRERGGVIAPWSQRRVAAAALIKGVNPDVIGVQEANDWANRARTYRQVDSLRGALATAGVNYTVAHTEALAGTPAYLASGYLRTGNYILYKPSVYRPIGTGGSWTLAPKVWAVYQELENIYSGARVLVVNTHLTQPGGYANDLARRNETQAMVAHGSSFASSHGVPVVYLGDYNSNNNRKQYTLDGPGNAMQALHIADARLVAQSRVKPTWDSMNNYMRAPFHYSLHIDYIWLSGGVSASLWGMAMRISGGRFVGVIPSDHNPIWAQLHYPY